MFGVVGVTEAANFVALGLHALQHRGQEAGGIVTHDPVNGFNQQRRMGLVRDNFTSPDMIASLPGPIGIGHVRYSTAGSKGQTALRDVQPFFGEFSMGGAAIAHNGNITNADALRRELIDRGSIFQSSSDSECIIHLMARSMGQNIPDRMEEALRKVEGAFSIVAMTRTKLIGCRDPLGVRPLVLGKIGDGWAWRPRPARWISSAPSLCAKSNRARWLSSTIKGFKATFRSVLPSRVSAFLRTSISRRPDSILGGKSVYEIRENIGRELAKEAPVDADLVCPVPDSGTPAAIGYSLQSGIPYAMGIIRNQYMGRTFIEPTESIRNMGVRLKLNVNRALIKGKRVILVDDSVVRGTTSRKIKEMILDAGAAEVHFRIASPPTAWPCFYGVDTPQREKLLAATMSEDEMRDHLGVDSLKFISLDGLYRAVGEANGRDAKCPPIAMRVSRANTL